MRSGGGDSDAHLSAGQLLRTFSPLPLAAYRNDPSRYTPLVHTLLLLLLLRPH